MSITIAFVCVVVAVLVAGTLARRWDESRHLRFTDEAGSTAATLSIARVEARKIVTHPTWLITLAFCSALVGLLVLLDPGQGADGESPAVWFALVGLPMGGLALIVSTHRIGTRSRRNGTEELEAATPTAPRTRTAGLLIACLAPLPVMMIAVALGIIVSRLASPYTSPPSFSNLVPLAGFVLPGVGGAVVGVLLARWMPFAVAPLLGIVAILWLNNGPDHLHQRFRWLRVAVEVSFGDRFDVRPFGMLLVFGAGLIALGACLALWRHPAGARLGIATLVAVAVIGGTGWSMTRSPSTSEVAAIVDEMENPTAHQHCETRAPVRYCVYPGAERWIDAWDPAVDAVLAQVPAAARPDKVVVVQRPLVDLRVYLTEVQAALDPSAVWEADGQVHPPMDLDGDRPDIGVAWQTAALAVGLPPSVDWEHPSGCLAGGQSRLVLAHVMAGRASTTTRAAWRSLARTVTEEARQFQLVPAEIAGEYDVDTAQGEGSEVDPGDRLAADGVTAVDYLTVTGATGWGSDVLAAEALASVDRAELDTVITRHWDQLVDPATTSEEFLRLAGIEAPGKVRPATSLADQRACP